MSRTELRLTPARNTDPFRDACRVMRQRVEICSHEDDEEEHNVEYRQTVCERLHDPDESADGCLGAP